MLDFHFITTRAALACCALIVLWPGAANAQTRPCPDGPGPGEFQIGVTGGSHGIAAVPICATGGAENHEDEPYDAPPPSPDVFMAVVLSTNSSALWTSTGYASPDAAQGSALKACERLMGKDCFVSWSGYNDFSIAVVEDAAGILFIDGDTNGDIARSKAIKPCLELSTGCRHVALVENSDSPRDSFPRQRPPLHRFAVIAWPNTAPPQNWIGKVWLASGVEGYQAGVDAAVALCQADTGVECVRGQHSTGGVLARYVDEAGKIYWIDAADRATAVRRISNACPQPQGCRLVDTFDTNDTRHAVIEELKSDAPVRGIYSLAWPAESSDAAPLTLVTGQPDRKTAREAALKRCEQDNKARCEPFFSDDDWGTEQFIKILLDGKGLLRVEFGYSEADVNRKMADFCKKDGVTCSGGQVVDLARPASLTLRQ